MKKTLLKILMTPLVFILALVGIILGSLILIVLSPIFAVFAVISFWDVEDSYPTRSEIRKLSEEELNLIEDIESALSDSKNSLVS